MKELIYLLTFVILSSFVFAASADIGIESFIVNPTNPRIGELITVNYVIANSGPDTVRVSFGNEISTPRGGTGGSGCCVLINPGQRIPRSFNFIPSVAGLHGFRVFSYPTDGALDPFYFNNTASINITVSGSGTSSPSFMKIAIVQNIDKSPTESTDWLFLIYIIVALVMLYLIYNNFDSIKQNKHKRRR
ncbi:hypothetical protein J4455_02355 [Candidatus Woesearchaeota archaeon]|nr:hypothetical protein [Candidatus Woesearchaeota archaeon]